MGQSKFKISYWVYSPSKMEILFDEKRIIVSGELTVTPAFYANLSSLNSWVAPESGLKLTEAEKQLIISTITNGPENKNVQVYFD